MICCLYWKTLSVYEMKGKRLQGLFHPLEANDWICRPQTFHQDPICCSSFQKTECRVSPTCDLDARVPKRDPAEHLSEDEGPAPLQHPDRWCDAGGEVTVRAKGRHPSGNPYVERAIVVEGDVGGPVGSWMDDRGDEGRLGEVQG